ncbi:MAG TPA: arylamine N-acetyltransferase [Campylobacterales bacterium]|nr:arylamine N-acetyltransferase [Campylobacterales bacterium]
MELTAQNFSLADYLSRIGFDAEPKADLQTLCALMSRQLQTVPFENTEVIAGRIPSLAPEDIVTKIVVHKRGGYCYEVNGLFAMALCAIGFKWYFAGARPMTYAERRPKTHMVVVAELEGAQWLCDCGFGGYGLRAPMEIADEMSAMQEGDSFKMELKDGEYLLSALVAGEWTKQYAFAITPQEWIEFSLANYFNATHPNTIFTQKKIAVMQTPKGRKILLDDELKIIENGVMQKQIVRYEECVRELFGLTI